MLRSSASELPGVCPLRYALGVARNISARARVRTLPTRILKSASAEEASSVLFVLIVHLFQKRTEYRVFREPTLICVTFHGALIRIAA